MTRMMWSGLVLVLVSVPVLAADVIEFRKVDYFEVVTKDNGEQDEEKRDARLEIDREAQTSRLWTRRTAQRRPPTPWCRSPMSPESSTSGRSRRG